MASRRRAFLRKVGIVGVAGLTGCSGTETDQQTQVTSTTDPPTSGDDTETTTRTTTAATTMTSTETTTTTTATPEPRSIAPEQTAKLIANDGDTNDTFGTVAISADGATILVGAFGDEDPHGEQAGSAYVFEREGESWTQQVKLVADDGDSDDGFGATLALSADGERAFVGAPGDEDPNGELAGSVYEFERVDGTWSQQAKLTPDDGDSTDRFGTGLDVASDGTVLLVGAGTDEDPNGDRAGAAYVFERDGRDDNWRQQAKLAASDPDTPDSLPDFFGYYLGLSADGETALVGATEDDESPFDRQTGAVYVFERAEGEWPQRARLVADDARSNTSFGAGIAVTATGTRAVIGALNEAAYVFERVDGTWTQMERLVPEDDEGDDWFGRAVALAEDGRIALVGAAEDDDPPGTGSAYVFQYGEGTWRQAAKLVASDGDHDERFGITVALTATGDSALVGAPYESPPHEVDIGAAYVFDLWAE